MLSANSPTGVAAVAPERLSRLIYLDAFVPEDGKTQMDYMGEMGEQARKSIR